MSGDTERSKIVQNKISWFVPWAAGFLFTVGRTVSDMPDDLPLNQQIISLLILWFLWPAALGMI
jgi:hypothetical protein